MVSVKRGLKDSEHDNIRQKCLGALFYSTQIYVPHPKSSVSGSPLWVFENWTFQ